MVDVNEERGKEVEHTFEEEYGTECIKFIRCDVSDESDLKGQLCLTFIIGNLRKS